MQKLAKLDVLVLSGGKASRLEAERKIITPRNFPSLPQYWHQEGPKGLTTLQINHHATPLLDLHLEQYWHSPYIQNITLGLGFASQMIIDYYTSIHPPKPLSFTTEKHPAGTIAPLLKLYQANKLSDRSLLLANGDNLLKLDFQKITLKLQEIKSQHHKDIFVLNILSLVPWQDSSAYGVANFIEGKDTINGFYEKQEIAKNPYIMHNHQRYSYINSGFSIITKPQQFIEKYLDPRLFALVADLDNAQKPYTTYEKAVKYETLYEEVAKEGILFGYHQSGYWADSGNEERILSIEAQYRENRVNS